MPFCTPNGTPHVDKRPEKAVAETHDETSENEARIEKTEGYHGEKE